MQNAIDRARGPRSNERCAISSTVMSAWIDDDGEYLFTIRDNDTLDTCYRHLTPPSKVVARYAWKRQK
jgi:hypothetical protein